MAVLNRKPFLHKNKTFSTIFFKNTKKISTVNRIAFASVMPLFSSNSISTNARPIASARDSPKMVLTPPRSPQLDALPLSSMNPNMHPAAMHRQGPSNKMNQFYVNGTTPPTSLGNDVSANHFFSKNTAAPTPQEQWELLNLMRAKAELAQLQSQLSAQQAQVLKLSQEQGLQSYAPSAGMEMMTNLSNPSVGSKRTLAEAKPSSSAPDNDEPASDEPKGKRQKKGKKPTDMPRRALSAYNIFFSEQRALILKEIETKESGQQEPEQSTEEAPSVLQRSFFPTRTKRAHRKVHGKIGLVTLARTVSKRWKELSDEKRKYYQGLAAEDKKLHKQAMSDYQERKAAESMLAIKTPSSQSAKETAPAKSMFQEEGPSPSGGGIAQQYQQQLLAELMAGGSIPQSNAIALHNLQQMSRRLNSFPPSQSRSFGGLPHDGTRSFGFHQNMW